MKKEFTELLRRFLREWVKENRKFPAELDGQGFELPRVPHLFDLLAWLDKDK